MTYALYDVVQELIIKTWPVQPSRVSFPRPGGYDHVEPCPIGHQIGDVQFVELVRVREAQAHQRATDSYSLTLSGGVLTQIYETEDRPVEEVRSQVLRRIEKEANRLVNQISPPETRDRSIMAAIQIVRAEGSRALTAEEQAMSAIIEAKAESTESVRMAEQAKTLEVDALGTVAELLAYDVMSGWP